MSHVACNLCLDNGQICSQCAAPVPQLGKGKRCWTKRSNPPFRSGGIDLLRRGQRNCRCVTTVPCLGFEGRPHHELLIRCDGCGAERLDSETRQPGDHARFNVVETRELWFQGWHHGLHVCPTCNERIIVSRDLALSGDPLEVQASVSCGWAFDLGLRLGPIPTDIAREGLGSQMRRQAAFHEQQKQKASAA